MKEIERDRASVLALSKVGKSVSQIVKTTHRSPTFVRKWLHRSDEGDTSMEDRPRAGRPTKITRGVYSFLRSKMYGVVRASPRLMGNKLKRTGIDVSQRTVSRFVKSLGWKPFRMTKSFLVTKQNRKSRLAFVTKFKNHTENDWGKWLFSDEKNFVLFRAPNSQSDRVYCLSRGEVRPKMIPKYSQSVMVWGGISVGGRTKLIFLKKGQRLSSDTYVSDILEPAVADINARRSTKTGSTKKLFRDTKKWVFQQDGAPPHRAKNTVRWLEENVPSFLPPTDWPGNSPDLNPIEHIWAALAVAVDNRSPRNLEELKRTVKEEWSKLDQNFIKKCVLSMPQRIAAVKAAKGFQTKY
jgi:transposase